MIDDMNALPVNAEWVKKVIDVTEHAAKELSCMVVLIAVQENGKLAIEFDGVPESGPLHDLAQDPPGMLATLSFFCERQNAVLRKTSH